MADIPVPSLSTSGWVMEIREQLDRLMSYFFYSDASQSNLYLGTITSLPEIIHKYGNDRLDLENNMRETLTTYLNRYFDTSNVNVTVTIPEDSKDNRMDVSLDCIVTKAGQRYDLSKQLRLANNKLVQIIERNNNG